MPAEAGVCLVVPNQVSGAFQRCESRACAWHEQRESCLEKEDEMRTLVFATLALLLCSATQDPGKCSNKGARIIRGGSSVSGPTSSCVNGDPCGYVLTYNTPRTECSPLPDHCCLPQVQQSYIRRFGCVDDDGDPTTPTVCLGSARDYFGPAVIVDVTVVCEEDGDCGHLPEDY